MRVQVTLQETEITRGFQRMYARANIGKRRFYLVLLALVITLLVVRPVIALIEKMDFYQSLAAAAAQPGVIIFFFVVFCFVYSFLVRYAPKQQYFREDGLLRSPREIRIERDGIYQSCRYSDSFTRWSGIMNIEDDHEFIMLYVDVVSCYLIPTRCFPSPAEASAFAAQAREFWAAGKAPPDAAPPGPWVARPDACAAQSPAPTAEDDG